MNNGACAKPLPRRGKCPKKALNAAADRACPAKIKAEPGQFPGAAA